jgi:hypothetical protein
MLSPGLFGARSEVGGLGNFNLNGFLFIIELAKNHLGVSEEVRYCSHTVHETLVVPHFGEGSYPSVANQALLALFNQ